MNNIYKLNSKNIEFIILALFSINLCHHLCDIFCNIFKLFISFTVYKFKYQISIIKLKLKNQDLKSDKRLL